MEDLIESRQDTHRRTTPPPNASEISALAKVSGEEGYNRRDPLPGTKRVIYF